MLPVETVAGSQDSRSVSGSCLLAACTLASAVSAGAVVANEAGLLLFTDAREGAGQRRGWRVSVRARRQRGARGQTERAAATLVSCDSVPAGTSSSGPEPLTIHGRKLGHQSAL